jgi:tRNA 2-thiocytidine biosynthesis protein TtcA
MKRLSVKKKSKRLKWFSKHVGRTIHRFHMIRPGEKILIGVSGGKDSLALSLALAERKKWVLVPYDLFALQIEWKEYPISSEKKKRLTAFFKALDIPYRIVQSTMMHPSFKNNFNCYICSRNRKRILFTEADNMGITKVALGHNLDDVIETTLLNIFFRGQLATIMPVQDFFKGKIKIIRPLYEVYEREIIRIAEELNLPVFSINCPKLHSNQRIVIKDIIRTLSHINKKVRDNIYRIPWHINRNYFPTMF